jgi:hypothetical protein
VIPPTRVRTGGVSVPHRLQDYVVATGAQREKKEPSLEEGSGSPAKCEPPLRPRYVEASIILFYFILFYFILFCFILFYFILFYFILFYFILFYFILFYFISHERLGLSKTCTGQIGICKRKELETEQYKFFCKTHYRLNCNSPM